MRQLRAERPVRHAAARASGLLRPILVTLATAAAAAVLAPAAAAVPPVMTSGSFSASTVMTGVCSFPVTVNSSVTFNETDFFDQSGALTRIYFHSVEQDTFSANGRSMTGLPFPFNIEILFDSGGNITHLFASGIVERIVLPDGSLFLTAGRLDFTRHPGAAFLLTPDVGNSGNVAAFCAALA